MDMHVSVLVLLHCLRVLASSCQPEPFAVPIKDIQVEPSIPGSFMRGIPAKIGSPEQDIVLAPWPDLNNTWIYDQQSFCESNVVFSDTICQVRRGNPFLEAESRSFNQSLDIIAAGGASQETDVTGSEAGVTKLIDSSLGGTDYFALGESSTANKLPIGIPRMAWDAGYTVLHALGLGSNSTYLNALQQNNQIGSRVWSIFWGRMWTDDNPLDGSIVFGGYDQRKIIGQNHTQALDFASTGCWTGMKVNVADVLVNYRTGNDQSIFPANTVLPVCIVPQRQLLIEVPGAVYENYEIVTNTTNIGSSFGLHWSAHLFDAGTEFDGDITIVLDSGLSIRIPNDQYVVPFVAIDRNGTRTFNTSQREVLIATIDQQPATLGRYFLTGAYLMVDQDEETFTLWQANPSTESKLMAVRTAKASADCNATSSSEGSTDPIPSPSASSTDDISSSAIVGAVLGGLTGGLVVFAGFFLLRRRRAQRRKSTFPGPSSETGFKHELPSNSAIGTTTSSDIKEGKFLAQELHPTPKVAQVPPVPPKDHASGSTRPVYEMGP